MNNQFTEIGKRLTEYLTAKGISQSKLARLTSTSASQIFNMLNGTKYGVDKLLSLFNALPDLNPEWLLFGHGSMERTQLTSNFTLTQLEKFAAGNSAAGNENPELSEPERAAVRLKELQDLLDICQAEREGLARIIELKDEMISVLKSQL